MVRLKELALVWTLVERHLRWEAVLKVSSQSSWYESDKEVRFW